MTERTFLHYPVLPVGWVFDVDVDFEIESTRLIFHMNDGDARRIEKVVNIDHLRISLDDLDKILYETTIGMRDDLQNQIQREEDILDVLAKFISGVNYNRNRGNDA